MSGSTHAHGMTKLNVSPDLLDLVSKFYAGNKAVKIFRCAVELDGIPDDEKYQLECASTIDESILA